MSWESVLVDGPATDVTPHQGEGLDLEVLYPGIADLGGDAGNIFYLCACLPGATLHQTHLGERPYFMDHHPDFVFLGNMDASNQERAAKDLAPWKERLVELADDGVPILFTGAAAEILGEHVALDHGRAFDGLGIFPFTTTMHPISERINDFFVGTADGIEILGWKSQFTESFGDNTRSCFARGTRGCGINLGTDLEGFRRGGLVATWLLGPFLVANPVYTEHLIATMGVAHPQLAFEKVARKAFERRIVELRDTSRIAD